MDTKSFNKIDVLIATLRFHEVLPYFNQKDIVFDFGCGHQAFFLNHINEKIRKGIGVDYDVKKEKKGNIELIPYHFKSKLPFKDKSFTKITLLAVLEHIHPSLIKALFKEFHRILSKKGIVLLTTPTPISKQLLEFLAYRLHLISEAEIRDHKKYYHYKDLMHIADENAFQIIKYKTFEFGLNSLCVMIRK